MTQGSLGKRCMATLYELLILMALWMLVTWVYLQWVGTAQTGISRLGLQLSLWLVSGAYFVRCWVKSGQTPATQAWRLRLVNGQGELLSTGQAIMRYMLASLLLALGGLGFWWAIFDKQHQFLHDRLLGSRWSIVSSPRST